MSARQRASFRLMLAHSAQLCRDAVLELFGACGGSAVYDKHLLQLRLRDVLTAAQHTLSNVRAYPLSGSVLAGGPLPDPML